MAENTSKQTVKSKVENANKFKWTDELVEDLLKCRGHYKTKMEFKGKNFIADKSCQYEEVRGLMLKKNESYTTLLGPADIPNIRTDIDEDEMERIEEERRTGDEKIKLCYKRMVEKIKKIRQSLSVLLNSTLWLNQKQLSMEVLWNSIKKLKSSCSQNVYTFANFIKFIVKAF